MNFVSRRGFILGTILLLLILNVHRADANRRRRQINNGGNNDLNWEVIIEDIRKIILIGPGLSNSIINLGRMISKVDELTNGAVSRVAGGYLPCVIDAEGFHCTGEAKDGGVEGVTKDIVNHTMLPEFAKKMIIDFLEAAAFPMFNAIVGVRVPSKKET